MAVFKFKPKSNDNYPGETSYKTLRSLSPLVLTRSSSLPEPSAEYVENPGNSISEDQGLGNSEESLLINVSKTTTFKKRNSSSNENNVCSKIQSKKNTQ